MELPEGLRYNDGLGLCSYLQCHVKGKRLFHTEDYIVLGKMLEPL